MPRGPKGEKRPADVIGAAIKVAKIATGEIEEDTKAENGKDAAAQELGRMRFLPRGVCARGDKTGSGAGRALFFVRYGCGLRRPTRAQGFVRRHSPDCIPARGVTNIFALAAALTQGRA